MAQDTKAGQTSSGQSKLPNVAPGKILAAEEFLNEDVGIVTFGDGERDDDIQEIDVESSIIGAKERTEKLAFNEEPVTIMISEGQDENNPEPAVFLSVNGRGAMPDGNPWVPRGVAVTIKRMYVETLARARPASYGSVERVNAQGEKEIVYPRSTSLRYPFSIIEDRNPKGSAWIRALLGER